MSALPKHRHSTMRQGKRRRAINLTAQQTVKCPACGRPKLPHRVCPHCGAYGASSSDNRVPASNK